jgi:hypothetical protein
MKRFSGSLCVRGSVIRAAGEDGMQPSEQAVEGLDPPGAKVCKRAWKVFSPRVVSCAFKFPLVMSSEREPGGLPFGEGFL